MKKASEKATKKKASLHVMKEEIPEPKPQIEVGSRLHPLVATLPLHLKDHANYEKIQRALLDTLASRHSHGEMSEWAACVSCQKKMRDHAEMMWQLGFRSPAQYMAWKKIHQTITDRVRLR